MLDGSIRMRKVPLSRLILGLLKPNQGQVLINEKIISNNKIIKATILSQNNFVFNGSIRDNIFKNWCK